MARLHEHIPENQRYSKKEMDEISKRLEGNKDILLPTDIALDGLYKSIKQLQDPKNQELIKFVEKKGSLPDAFQRYDTIPMSTSIKDQIPVYNECAEQAVDVVNRLEQLKDHGILDDNYNLRKNIKDNWDYFSSLDTKKIEGFVQEQKNRFAEACDRNERRNRLTPEEGLTIIG